MGIVKKSGLADLIAGSGLVGAGHSAAVEHPPQTATAPQPSASNARPATAPTYGSSKFPPRPASGSLRHRSPPRRPASGRPGGCQAEAAGPLLTSSLQQQAVVLGAMGVAGGLPAPLELSITSAAASSAKVHAAEQGATAGSTAAAPGTATRTGAASRAAAAGSSPSTCPVETQPLVTDRFDDPILQKRVAQLQHQLAESRNQQQLLQEALAAAQAAGQEAAAEAEHQGALLSKQFKRVKALEAEREAWTSAKRTAAEESRQLQRQVAQLQSRLEQTQEQLAAEREASAAAAKAAEAAAATHRQHLRAAQAAAAKAQGELAQKLATKEALLQDTEDTLRGELLRRTHTILSMQAQLEQQDADLAAARGLKQGADQDQDQAAATPRAEGQQGAAEEGCSGDGGRDQGGTHANDPAAAVHESGGCSEPSAHPASSSSSSHCHQEGDTATDVSDVDLQMDVTSSSRPSSPLKQQQQQQQQRGRPRPVSSPPPGRQRHATLQLGQQQQQQRQGGGGGSGGGGGEDALTVEHLSQQLAAAQLQLARSREQHAQQLVELSQRLAGAESSQQQGVQAMGAILTALTERTAAVLASRAAAAALPYYRPPASHYMQQQKLAASSSRPASSSSTSSAFGRTMSPSRGTLGAPRHQEYLEEGTSRPHSAYSTVSIYQHPQQQQQQHHQQQQLSPLRQRPQSAFTTGPAQHCTDTWGLTSDQQQQQQQPSSRLCSSSRSRTSSPRRPAMTTMSRAAAATAVFSDSEEEEGEVEVVDCSQLEPAGAEDALEDVGEGGAVRVGATTRPTTGTTTLSPRPRSSRAAGLTVTLAPDVTDGGDAWGPGGMSDTASPKDITRTLLASGMTAQQQQQQRELVQEASLAAVWAGHQSVAAGLKSNRKGRAQAMELLCDRLMAENAFLLAELSKWEVGWHSCQVYGSGQPPAAAAAAAGGATAQLGASTSTSRSTSSTLGVGTGGGGGEGQLLPPPPQQQQSLSRPCSAATTTTKRLHSVSNSRPVSTGRFLGAPVHDALRLAVRSALEAAKGELLPLALTSGTATWVNPEDPGGWAAAGGNRLEAALSAAAVNMKLRARVVELEAGVLTAKASAASDEATVMQQQALLDQQASELLALRGQLANAKAAMQVQQDKARAALTVAAAATCRGGAGGAAAGGGGGMHTSTITSSAPASRSTGAVTQGGAAAGPAAAGGGGGGWHTGGVGEPSTASQRQGWPQAAVEEVARLRAAADAASRDKVVKERLLQQLQVAHNQLASKLLAAQQRIGRKDTLILAMQQQLAAAQMTLLDHNLDLPSSQAASGFACWGPEDEATTPGQASWAAGVPSRTVCMAAAGLHDKGAAHSHESAAAAADGEEGSSSSNNWAASTAAGGIISSGSSCSNDVAAGAGDQSPPHTHLPTQQQQQQRSTSNGRGGWGGQQQQQQHRPWSASTAGSSRPASARPSTAGGPSSAASQAPSEAVTVSAAVTAGPLSFTAAMDSRKWQRECRRLQWVMAQQAEQLEAARRESQKLHKQLSAHTAASQAALDAAARDSRHQRESLAGDLEGATTAMQDAVKRLASSESTRQALRQALDEEQRRVQQLTWDVAYLRQRAAAAKAAAGAQAAVADGHASHGGSAELGADVAVS